MTDTKSLADIGHTAWFRCNAPEGMPDIPLSTRAPEYQAAWHAAAKAIRRAVIDECIQTIENDFHWILPMFADEQANSVSDDAAEAVRDQVVQFVRSLKGESDA